MLAITGHIYHVKESSAVDVACGNPFFSKGNSPWPASRAAGTKLDILLWFSFFQGQANYYSGSDERIGSVSVDEEGNFT